MKAWPLIVLALVFTAHHTASACSCVPPPPPLEALAQSTAVFSATVVSVETEDGIPGGVNTVLLRVHRTWKGVSDRTVTVTTASSGAACGFFFQEGDSYLVYAHGTATDLSVNSCSRTRLLANAQEDLAALGPGTSTLPPWLAQLLRWILLLLCTLGFDVCDLLLYL